MGKNIGKGTRNVYSTSKCINNIQHKGISLITVHLIAQFFNSSSWYLKTIIQRESNRKKKMKLYLLKSEDDCLLSFEIANKLHMTRKEDEPQIDAKEINEHYEKQRLSLETYLEEMGKDVSEATQEFVLQVKWKYLRQNSLSKNNANKQNYYQK